uniref:Uncharacterized protein n=1 Tax=Rhizophagus irregularis (strain DAOM 181602 / DAOM 197198 / MUCL 43194) TaxID=747089 RepID=U9U1J0_RHIID
MKYDNTTLALRISSIKKLFLIHELKVYQLLAFAYLMVGLSEKTIEKLNCPNRKAQHDHSLRKFPVRTDGEYSADTDDDKNPESSQNHKRKRRHVANEDYEINDYRTDTDDDENPESESYTMQELHIEEDSQLAQYSFTMLEWSVVNFEMFVEAGWASCCSLSLNGILTARFAKSYYKIDTSTCIPVISAVISYISIPCHGLGSELSENHIKAELWTNILSNSFSLNNPKFVNVWEFHHLIPGNVNKVQQNSAITKDEEAALPKLPNEAIKSQVQHKIYTSPEKAEMHFMNLLRNLNILYFQYQY